MIPFYLITGFLGSGKTTFLKELLARGTIDHKIVIIQNEFAPSGIDGIELKQEKVDFELIEINNGSVFCSCLMGSFIENLKKIVVDYQPDKIYLEASGLADPSSITQVMDEGELHQIIYLAGSICVVDALNYSRALNKLPRVLQQIRVADTIFINKTDLVSLTELDKIGKRVKALNPFAEIYHTKHCKIPPGLQFSQKKKDSVGDFMFGGNQGSGRPSLQSTVLKTAQTVSSCRLEPLIAELSRISIRAKGFINLENQKTILFQSVFNDFSFIQYDKYPGNTEITLIGENICIKVISDLFKRYAN